MKKLLITLSAVAMLLIGTLTANAAVKWESKDGKTFCTLTYKNDGATQMYVIGTFTENWKEPGWQMEKNAEGLWEITFEMPRAKEFYKFFNPDLDGDKYIEDPEAPDTIANPFGSKNGILRKPKDAGASGAAASNEPEEEEYPQVNFGMWSRNTYNIWVKTQLSGRVGYKQDGTMDLDGEKIVYVAGGDTKKYKKTGLAVDEANLMHRWEGENGTTAGNATRIWLDQTRLRSSSTFKVHGKVFKHMVLDTEVNFNFIVDTGYNNYWDADTAKDREHALNTIQRDAASQYMGLFWGPFSKNGAWGRWVGEYTGTWDSTMSGDNNVIWIDQIVISFPFDDFEFKAGIMGNNAAQSKDPMALLSGKRTGNKEDIGSNMEWYIHPSKVKNLNFLLGLSHTWRDSGLEKGQGEVWWTGSRVDNNDRKYITYFDFNYEISIAQFGLAWYWNSWSPAALDMFVNGEFTVAPWFRLKPIKGMTIEGELATNVSTIYMDNIDSNDNNIDWKKYRKAENTWDVFANSAALLRVGYVYSQKLSFNIDGSVKAAGTEFKGMLGGEGGQFSGWYNSSRRVNGITNYTVGPNPYYDNDKGAGILSTLDFGINPIPNQKKLLKIGLKNEFNVGKLDSPLMETKYEQAYEKIGGGYGWRYKVTNDVDHVLDGYQANKYQFDWLCTPNVGTELLKGKIALGADVTFSVTNYRDDTLFTTPIKSNGSLDATQTKQSTDSTTFATFNSASVNATFSDISKVLKSVKIDYKVELAYYNAYWPSNNETVTEGMWKAMKDSIQVKTMYNQVVSEFSFAKDITLGFGFIFRNYFGDQSEGNIYNKLNNNVIDKFSNGNSGGDIKYLTNGTITDDMKRDLGLVADYVNSKQDLKKVYNYQRYDYWNFGIAMQFKYKIPVDWLQFPILFVNLGLGWDPFDDDGSTTQNWYKEKDSAHNYSWKKNNSDWSSERSVFTIGLVWDF